ncbi:MAG: GNAT family N-acetyltransferase, partial [Clostridia bacterium]|nr:GNAT family N-acetyltransferase [Clostridia bacterium]
MRIYRVTDKKQYLSLLLLADEQESMIDRYLDKSEMFVLDDDGVKGEIVVCERPDGICEIKNLAVVPEVQNRGYGRKLIDFVCDKFKNKYPYILVG